MESKLLFFAIFGSFLGYNFGSVDNHCKIEGNFDMYKLSGLWNYVAEVNPQGKPINCRYLFLHPEAKNLSRGYWLHKENGNVTEQTLLARFYNNSFELAYMDYKDDGPVVEWFPITARICEGNTEFALEDAKYDLYYIFSRNYNLSKEFEDKYEALAHESQTQLTRMNNTNCGPIDDPKFP